MSECSKNVTKKLSNLPPVIDFIARSKNLRNTAPADPKGATNKFMGLVDKYIRYLIGYESSGITNFLYKEYYENGFEPKIVAILAIKNSNSNSNSGYNDYNIWKHDINKYLSLFFNDNKQISFQQHYKLYDSGLSPLLVSINILKDQGYIPIILKSKILSSSPPKI